MSRANVVTKVLSVIIIITLIFAVVVSIGSTTQKMGGPSKTTPGDLPIVKLPKELAMEPFIEAGNPHGTPPGQDKKPKPPEPPEEPGTNKWAVVIGIADYEGRDYDLWHSDEDAKEMYNVLTSIYGFPKDNIKLLINRKATFRAINSAMDWLIQNEDVQSSVVFFFSGHGFRVDDGWDPGQDNDLESDGMDEGIVSYEFVGITDGYLKDKLSALESTKVVLGFGSCNSGGMFDDDDDLQGENRVIASACKADQYAWDYLLLGNTLWGKYFVDEGLLQGLADPDGDDSIEEAHDYAYPEVVALQPDSQPQLSDGYSGDLIP